MTLDPTQGRYAISVAAQLTGLHPQTLRLYESKGLVDPARTDGGTRRYSDRDIERLRRISTLLAGGPNLAAVKVILDLQDETGRLGDELEDLRRASESRD